MRRIAVVVLLGLLAMSASGTSGFTSVNAERNVVVAVGEDNDAFLGLDATPLDRCGDQHLYHVINRFPETTLSDIDVHVIATEGVRVTVTETPTYLSPGEVGEIRIRVTPDPFAGTGTPGTLTVAVTATGPDTRVFVKRTHEVTCSPSNTRDGTGDGNSENNDTGVGGNAETRPEESVVVSGR